RAGDRAIRPAGAARSAGARARVRRAPAISSPGFRGCTARVHAARAVARPHVSDQRRRSPARRPALAGDGRGSCVRPPPPRHARAADGPCSGRRGVVGLLAGAGTVLDEGSARAVIAAGARFVVSPTLDQAVVRCCRDANVPCMPGALTPRELVEASRAGASHIKLFPASLVGPRYIREVLAPLPFLRLVPSGGVSLDNAGDWIRAGAIAVSLGSALVSPSLVTEQAWDRLTARARALIDRVAEARRQPAEAPA